MKPNEIKKFSAVTAAIAILISAIILLFTDASMFSMGGLKALNLSITIVSGLWAIYFTYGWKWPYVRKLLFRPDLNGTWLGEFHSDWKDKDGQGISPRPFVMTIRQSFFSMSVQAFTEQQKTFSHVESLVFDRERGLKILAYIYSQKRVREDFHDTRQGAAELDLVESENSRLLEGDFWTLSHTSGYVRVKQSSEKHQVESYIEATNMWSDKSLWANV